MSKTKRGRHHSVSNRIDDRKHSVHTGRHTRNQRAHVLPEFVGQVEQSDLRAMQDNDRVGFRNAADAWHATYGTHVSRALIQHAGPEFMVEAVIGRDDRVRIRNTNEYPYSAICSLEITANTGRSFVGTGWLVDRHTIVTAGHCVYLPDQGGWAKRIRVYPARNGEGDEQPFQATALHSVEGWTRGRRPQEDYGAISIAADASAYGSLGFAVLNDRDIKKSMYHVVGYPADKPVGTLWGHVRELREARKRTLIYDTDTYGGNSGGPVFCIDEAGGFLAVGIHNYGDISGNSATRITTEVFNNIHRWNDPIDGDR